MNDDLANIVSVPQTIEGREFGWGGGGGVVTFKRTKALPIYAGSVKEVT